MGTRIGIIAGRGRFPRLALEIAGERGTQCVVAAVRGEADAGLEAMASDFSWFEPGEFSRLVSYFKDSGVESILLAGKVDPRVAFGGQGEDEEALRLLNSVPQRTPSALIRAFLEFLTSKGFRILDPMPFLGSLLCRPGPLTKTPPDERVQGDVDFAWPIARKLADLDVGQTVVVKGRVVVAVEGLEGTDEVIKRSGRLAGQGTVVLKVSRSDQDARIDLPAVGLITVQSLVESGAEALCIEAERIPFFQRKESVELANRHGLVLFARRP